MLVVLYRINALSPEPKEKKDEDVGALKDHLHFYTLDIAKLEKGGERAVSKMRRDIDCCSCHF